MVSHRNQWDKLEHKTHFHLRINSFLCLPCKMFWPILCPTFTWSSQNLCETQTILILALKKKGENLFTGFDTFWLSNGSAYMGLPEAWFLNLISISNNFYFLALHLLESNSLHLLLASSLPVIPEMSSKYHCDVGKESIYSAPELFLSFHPQSHF